MKPEHRLRQSFAPFTHPWFGLAAVVMACSLPNVVRANPEGMTVVQGAAQAQANGSQLNITVGQHTFLDWRTFNIQSGETTRFLQPSSDSIVFNRIGDAGPSQIWGSLNANGTVILANTHGVYFGPNSSIVVGGNFIATTAPITPDLGAAAGWQFTGLPPLASIVNYGLIQTGEGRSLFLIAEKVQNHGDLRAPGGNVGLQSGEQVLLSERPDGRGLSAKVKLPSGAIDNTGRVVADGGSIALNAQVVNQNGVLQADSVQERNGIIELVASQELNLGSQSQIFARGDRSATGGHGGEVILKSEHNFRDAAGSEIGVAGGSHGGDGGSVEVSAPNILSLASHIDAGAQSGSRAGSLLLDPTDIVLNRSGGGSAGHGTVGAGDGAGILELNVDTAFLNMNFSEITLQATRNITLASGTAWDLSASTGLTDGHLTLQAGNNIIFQNNARISDANNWSVRLDAGVDFASGATHSGVGSIFLNGGAGQSLNGAIETAHGSIEMSAGSDILVGAGYIRTAAGGGIHLQALAGDIDAGKKNDGYEFFTGGYRISLSGLGGIATAAGGDVTLEAGRDIISVPTTPNGQPPGASGAYGPEPGDVTLVAGRTILGNYLVRNGTGSLFAGVSASSDGVPEIINQQSDIGSAMQPVNLSLVSGSWNLWAGRDVFISEVRNPNGTFNRNRLPVPAGAYPGNISDLGIVAPPSRIAFLFDYAPDAAANVWAGQGITLLGANLPRVTGQNQNMPPIYPPQLSLDAGAGGIEIDNSLVLFPSSQGSLHITTRDGGNLIGQQQRASLTGITMSDSGLPDWASFASGHAATPLHLQDADPVQLNISGGVENFGLTVPTFAQVNIAGDAYNFGFLGQNLSPSAVTEINISGDLHYRGNLTSVPLSDSLPVPILDPALSANSQVTLKLRYDAAAHSLTFIGQMTESDLAFLLEPRALWFDPFGRPLDANGEVIQAPGVPQGTIPVQISSTQRAAFQELYTQSQSASLGDNGLALAGPGTFRLRANNADLGISGGLNVLAPNAALAPISQLGANLDITLLGNLDMTSTKIANESFRGDISLNVGGTLDVGGQFTTFGDPSAPKGIFTSSGGNVSVIADGDVNVNGSRIATYNGGNVGVRSEHGDVNAGSGGAGYIGIRALDLEPSTGQLRNIPATIPGSGILATTVAGGSAGLGNISVDTPEGSINASLGGIVQLAFNNANTRASFIELKAGKDINAGGSGVIGSNIRLDAGGNIYGVIIGSQNVDIQSQQSVNVTAFGGGGVNISAAGNVSGTVVSGGNVNVSGDAISAALVSKSVSTSGDVSSTAIGVPQSNVAKADTKVAEDASETTAKANQKQLEDEEENKRKTKQPQLTRKIGRVTVILPPGK